MKQKYNWTDFKAYYNSVKISPQYNPSEDPNYYYLYCINGQYTAMCVIEKGTADAVEFETDYADLCNKSIMHKQGFFRDNEGKTLKLDGSFNIYVAPGQIGTFDKTITVDSSFGSGELYVWDCNRGDRLSLNIVHPAYGVLPGKDFFRNYLIHPGPFNKESYAADIPAGLIMRVTVENNGANPTEMVANVDLHEPRT